MILYGSSFSPYVRKTLAFAAEKGIELDSRPIRLRDADPEFRQASPFGKMPAFRHPGAGEDGGDFLLSDSTAIIAYLDALKPEPVLIPAEPKARATAFWWEEFADTILAPAGAKIFFNRIVAPLFLQREGDEQAAAKAEAEELPPLLDHLEAALGEDGHMVGGRLTLADLAVASPFANLRHLGIGIDAKARPKLAAFVAAMLARPSFFFWIEKEERFLAKTAPQQGR
ncbi:MAG: glutathione S-transferase family protein [Sphingomonadaceae bacterium]